MESAAQGDHVERGRDVAARGSGRRRRRDEYERALERDAANPRLDEQERLRLQERRRDEYECALEWDAMNAQLDEQERLDKEQDERSDPASGPAMLALPLAKVGETKEEDCAICLDKFLTDSWKKLRTMPCSHSFHQSCIFDWLMIDRRCPICRFAMASEKQRVLEEEEKEELHGPGVVPAAAAGDVDIYVGTSSPSYPICFFFDSNYGGLMPA